MSEDFGNDLGKGIDPETGNFIQTDDHNHLKEAPDEGIIAEAQKFNQILDENEVSSDFLSRHLTKDQNPENVREQIEKALEKLRDPGAFGTLLHGVDNLSDDDFKEILCNGLRSRESLNQRGKKFSGLASKSIYPRHVSFSMTLPDLGDWRDERVKTDFNYSFMIEPKVIEEILKTDQSFVELFKAKHRHKETYYGQRRDEMRELIRFVGRNFGGQYSRCEDYDPEKPIKGNQLLLDILEYAKRMGWIDAAKRNFEKTVSHMKSSGRSEDKNDPLCQEIDRIKQFDEVEFANTYFRNANSERNHKSSVGNPWPSEVIIADSALNRAATEPFCGIIIPADQKDRILGLLNSLSAEDIRNAIPIYDRKGNLLWPKQMTREEVKQFVSAKEAKN